MPAPRVSEVDYQRERLRRELQELLNALDAANAEHDDESRERLDAAAALRCVVVGGGVSEYVEAVRRGAIERIRQRPG